MKLTYSPVGQVIYCSLIKYIYLPTYLPTYLHIQNKYQDCIPSNALGGEFSINLSKQSSLSKAYIIGFSSEL